MELSKQKVLSRWGITNLIFWPLYTLGMFWVFYWAREQPGYLNWPLHQQVVVILVPLLPVAIWLLMMGRMLNHTKDGLETRMSVRSAATAGVITMMALFSHGLYGIVFEKSATLVLNGIDITSFLFVGLFLVMYSTVVSYNRLRSIA